MKKSLALSIVASTMIMAGGSITPAEAVVAEVPAAEVSIGTFGDALKNGEFTAALRTFYFDRSFDEDKTGNPNATALTFGGILKYESASYYGAKFGIAYYGSQRIGGIFSREEGVGTSILGRDGENLGFLGEAFLEYDISNTMVKVGRQQLATPLIQNHDLRILPSVYEAAILRNTDISDTMIELGYVGAYTGFTSKENEFLDFNEKWGDKGLAYIYLNNKSIENLTIRAQYVGALSDVNDMGELIAVNDYRYIDAKYAIPMGKNSYIKAQYGGNAYNIGEDSSLFGAKAGTTFWMVDVAVLYDKISDNNFKAVESGPMYSDWQQGYGPYEPSTAFGGQIVIKPLAGLSLKLGYVDVTSDTQFLYDDFTEFNLDLKYAINDWSAIRVRYSIKDQSDASEALRYDGIDGNGGREDRDDFRIIYYMNF